MASKEPISWPLLPVPDPSGRLSWPDLEDSIAQCIRSILRIRPGEQLMRPNFGVGLENFIGASDEPVTRKRIQETITLGLQRWEPRIQLSDVAISEGAEPGWLRIDIHYRIRRSGAPRRLGLTLSLEEG